MTTLGIVLSYVAVVPYSAPQALYNIKVRENFTLLFLSLIGPLGIIGLLYSTKAVNFNMFIKVFHLGFFSYFLVFISEYIMATFFRLGIFYWLEKDIFKLSPKVPAIFLPWVFSDHNYKINRLTAFACEFATNCIGAPIIEELIKYKVVMWAKAIKIWQIGDPLPRFPGDDPPSATPQQPSLPMAHQSAGAGTNAQPRKNKALASSKATQVPATIHTYMLYMVGAGLGLKTLDNFRRILMYTKPGQTHKHLFAALRGLFPVQELCAALTAIRWARRDLLGEGPAAGRAGAWRLFVPSVLLHAFANFRGTRPVFKWKADYPWMDIQLQPPNTPDEAGLGRLVSRGLRSVLWASILLRVLGHVIKSYWRISKAHQRRVRLGLGPAPAPLPQPQLQPPR